MNNAVSELGRDSWELDILVEGSWSDPQFKFEGEIPLWLETAMQRYLTKQLEATENQNHLALEQRLREIANSLQHDVAQTLENGQAIVQQQFGVLSVARKDIQTRLDEITGDAFTADRSLPVTR